MSAAVSFQLDSDIRQMLLTVGPRSLQAICKTAGVLQTLQHLLDTSFRTAQLICDMMLVHTLTLQNLELSKEIG